MTIWRILALGECGWANFIYGHCATESVATAQASVFQYHHPQRVFQVVAEQAPAYLAAVIHKYLRHAQQEGK